MDKETYRRFLIKLMNLEQTLRNIGEFIENDSDADDIDYERLLDMQDDLNQMADKISDMHTEVLKLKEAAR